MYCSDCGFELSETFRHCPQCGARRPDLAYTEPGGVRRLRRPVEGKKIAGVCAGIAHYLNLDVTLVRIVVAMLAVYPLGLGLIFYIIAWIAIPREPWIPPHLVVREGNPAGATDS
jgi:phage shock protein C